MNKLEKNARKTKLKFDLKMVLEEKKNKKTKSFSEKQNDKENKIYEREKKRKQRDKVYADPELHKQFLKKQRYHNLKRKMKGLTGGISKMSEIQKEAQRNEWRKLKRMQRNSKKLQSESFTDNSITEPLDSSLENLEIPRNNDSYKKCGARKARKNREAFKKKIED